MTKYRVIKKFTDYDGIIHNPGEVAILSKKSTYGVLSEDEIPLEFDNQQGIMGVTQDKIELIEGETLN